MKKTNTYIFLTILIFLNIFYTCKSYSNENEQILYGEENQYYNEYLKNIDTILNKEEWVKYLKYFQENFGGNIPISKDMFQYGNKNKPCKIVFMTKKVSEIGEGDDVILYLKCRNNTDNVNIKDGDRDYYVQLTLTIEKNKLTLYTRQSKYLCTLLFAYENWKQCGDYDVKGILSPDNAMFYGRDIKKIK